MTGGGIGGGGGGGGGGSTVACFSVIHTYIFVNTNTKHVCKSNELLIKFLF